VVAVRVVVRVVEAAAEARVVEVVVARVAVAREEDKAAAAIGSSSRAGEHDCLAGTSPYSPSSCP
jgi:hypothetical protein